jgi:hypothetical protein
MTMTLSRTLHLVTLSCTLCLVTLGLLAVSFQLLTFGRVANGQITVAESIKATTQNFLP